MVQTSPRPAPPPPAAPKASILLVDDQRANLLAVEAILESLGQNVVCAASGEEALRKLLGEDFAVVLLDVQMPGLDGYETAQLIRSRERSRLTPLIFLTAYDPPDVSVLKAYATGAVDYLVKPIVPEILRAKVAVFVELFQKSEEIKRQAAELKRSNQELEQFAYVASHDLKEPLRKVRIYLQLLQQRYSAELDAEAGQFMQYVLDAAERMQRLVSDLLTYARVGSRGQAPQTVDSAAAFDEALAHLEVAVRECGAGVTRGPLPVVSADRAQLVQLFQNLLGNAIKFRRAGIVPEVRVDAQRDLSGWLFSVCDNGIGIERQYAERVFVIFERLHNQKDYAGTGIGLAICKKIVERHGGSIWFDSEPGNGTTFKFTLPSARGEPQWTAPPASP